MLKVMVFKRTVTTLPAAEGSELKQVFLKGVQWLHDVIVSVSQVSAWVFGSYLSQLCIVSCCCRYFVFPEQALRLWHAADLWDQLCICAALSASHNNRPVWLCELAILCAVCFTWARQWPHLASLLCWGLLHHHSTPAMPHPAPSLAWLCTCSCCWDSWPLDGHCWPHPGPASHFEDCWFLTRAKLETS